MKEKRKQNGFLKTALCVCFLAVCAAAVLFFLKYHGRFSSEPPVPVQSEIASGELTVCFVDSGQSDCIIVKTAENSVLIDAGQDSDYEKIADALHSLGITEINLFIATHPHSDHIGSAEKILKSYPVGMLLVPDIPNEFMPQYSLYDGMIAVAERTKTKVSKAKIGTKYILGDGIYLSVLGPCGNYATDLNNWSVVTRLTCGDCSFLFAGDAEEIAEKDLINSGAELSSTVLKLGHHGSHSSTSAEFLKKVSPKYAVITCGKGNDYGHPNKSVLTALKKSGASIYRTDLNGRIIFTVSGKTLNVYTEK